MTVLQFWFLAALLCFSVAAYRLGRESQAKRSKQAYLCALRLQRKHDAQVALVLVATVERVCLSLYCASDFTAVADAQAYAAKVRTHFNTDTELPT